MFNISSQIALKLIKKIEFGQLIITSPDNKIIEINGSKNSSVKWNFQKYLVGPEGNLVDYWYSLTSPSSSKITNYLR